MATPVIISLLVGLVAGGGFMAIWAANRIEEESVRQFDRGFERGRWLTDITVAKAIEDQDRARRVGLLVAGAHQPRQPPHSPPRPGTPPVAAGPPVGGRSTATAHRGPQSGHRGRSHARRPGRRRHPGAGRARRSLAAHWRRRLATRRFDAVYERNLLRRTGRG